VRPIKIGKTLSARAQFTLPAHFGKIKQSHEELGFSLSVALVCLSFSYFVFACTFFFYFAFCETQRKTSKM